MQNGHIVLFLESASLDKEEEVGNNNKKEKKNCLKYRN